LSDYYHDDPVEYYSDDPVEEKKSGRFASKFITTAVLIFGSVFYFQGTIAGNITLNSRSAIEFGQSVNVTAACSGATSLTVTPKSSFTNAAGGSGTYYLSSVLVSNIPASCNGEDFSLSFYDSATGSSALPIFSNLFGENKNVATVFNNNGYFLQGFQGSGTDVSGASGAFTVTFKTPVALSTNAMKVTLQSTEHKDWAEASIALSSNNINEFTCALLSSSGMKCWGRGGEGMLGDGASVQRNSPVNVSGLTSGVTSIAAGGLHSCALLNTGVVQCWGYNGNGQLGDNTLLARSTPVNVTGLSSRVAAIDAGDADTCALLTTGEVRCWGRNYYGSLGNGTVNTDSAVPVAVSGISNAVAITSGGLHNCAILSTGAIKCWGPASEDLGTGSTGSNSYTPTDVLYINNAVAISAGNEHTCAVLSTGAVKCWGTNAYGQLGDGTTNSSSTPVNVSNFTNAVAISAGPYHTCVLLSTGAVQCWGYGPDGQIGDGSGVNKLSPTAVSGLTSGVRAIGTGFYHSCAVLSTGAAKCWGKNNQGQLGNNSTIDSLVPVSVTGIP